MQTIHGALRALAIAATLALTAGALRAQAQFAPIGQAFTFSLPQFGNMPNCQPWIQESIVTHGEWQYVAWWNENRHVAVGRRRPLQSAWETLELADYRIAGQDAHNTVSIGVCPGDGTLHLAFDDHVETLHYRRSVPGLARDPAAFAWLPSLFQPVTAVLDTAFGTVTNVTYPRFVATPTGDLLLAYREFGSGSGRERLVDYSAATGTWSGNRVFIERTGGHTDPLGGTSSSRNPYLNRLEFDDQGTLHATWTWRENAPIPYNRDIDYAFSEDGGATWRNGAGAVVSSRTAGTAITQVSPGILGVQLGAEWGLMNDQGQVVDHRGRVHVVMYHKRAPDTVVSYGDGTNSNYFHYWRDADGSWRSFRLATMGSRPTLLCDARDTLYLLYVSGTQLRLDVATAAADYRDWRTAGTLTGNFGAVVQADHVLFARNLLTVALQLRPATDGQVTPFGVVDVPDVFVAAGACPDFDPCPTERAIVADADLFVQDGVYASGRNGASHVLAVRSAASPGLAARSYLRFPLATLLGHGAVARAVLRLHVPPRRPLPAPATIAVRHCAADTWSETATDWNAQPTPDGGVHTGTAGATADVVEIDVTDLVATELAAGDTTLSLQLTSLKAGDGRLVEFCSRESPTGLPPTLTVEQQNLVVATADTYVRNGTWAGTAHGREAVLTVKEDASPDFDRFALLRFPLATLRGTGTIDRVWLVATNAGSGALARTTPYFAHAVADDAWSEDAVSWATAPAPGAGIAAQFGRARMCWDVTAAVRTELAGDGILSIALTSAQEGTDRALNVASRDSAIPSRWPRLVVHYR